MRQTVGYGLLALLAMPHYVRADDRPNVLLVLADDLGWRDVGYAGTDFYETPHIDRLASQGMVFTNAYSNAPNCAPTRACLMTGLYGPRHGIFTVGDPARGNDPFRRLTPIPNKTVLGDRFVTLPEVLQSAGYRTGIFGKWHLGGDPTTQGFGVNVDRRSAGIPRGYIAKPGRQPASIVGAEYDYLPERFAAAACEFIETSDGEPFFAYFAMHVVHTPIEGKPKLVAKYETKPKGRRHNNAEYAAMIEPMDAAVGTLLAKLEDEGLAENTIVIFFSDNGGYGPATTMAPLRGSKGMLYEGGIRVPMIIRWPDRIPAGATCEEPVIGLDFFPTLLELAGVATPRGLELDGQSLAPLLTHSGEWEDRELFWHFPAYLESYVKQSGPFRITPAGSIRSGRWKLIEFFEDGRLELYDLNSDIGEQTNLADSEPEQTKKLLARMQAWRQRVDAPMPTTPNPQYDPHARWTGGR